MNELIGNIITVRYNNWYFKVNSIENVDDKSVLLYAQDLNTGGREHIFYITNGVLDKLTKSRHLPPE